MTTFLETLRKWPATLASAVVTVLLAFYFQSAFSQHLPQGSPGYAALQMSFSVQRFAEVLEIWGPQNVQRYQVSMWADFFFPASYAFLFSSLLVKAAHNGKPLAGIVKWLCLAPFLAAMLDYIENVLHLALLGQGSPFAAGMVLLSACAASFKWALLGGVIPLGLVCLIVQRSFRKKALAEH